MKVLVAGFKGKNNSSKIFLDRLKNVEKLYLDNDKEMSCQQLFAKVKEKDFDRIIIFGQKPLIKDKLSIELSAKSDFKGKDTYKEEDQQTRLDLTRLCEKLEMEGILYKISNKAGNSYCNNIYYYALSEIQKLNTGIKCLFIHIPQMKNFSNFENVVNFFDSFLEDCLV